MPLYILLYHIKELVFYGIHPISAEKLIENGFNLFFAIILLIFYNKLVVHYKKVIHNTKKKSYIVLNTNLIHYE